MSQLNKTETDVEPLIVTVGKQQLQTDWVTWDLSATVNSHDFFMPTVSNFHIVYA